MALRTEGATARAVGLDALAAEIAAADLVVACTGAVGTVVGEDDVRRGLAGRDTGRPAGRLRPGPAPRRRPARRRDRGRHRRRPGRPRRAAALARAPGSPSRRRARSSPRRCAAYFAAQRTAEVTPTVTALRRRAAEVVDAELLRLDGRMPDLDERSRSEVAQTVRRVVDKLLHTPTVQVRAPRAVPGRRHLRRGAARAVRARPADARGAGRHRVEHPHRERRARRRGRPGAGRRHPGSRGRR